MNSLLRYDYFYCKNKTVMFLHIKEEGVSSMLLICSMPCSLCCDVKQYKNKDKNIISSTYVNKYVLLIINYQFCKSITRHNALLKRIFCLLLGKITK